MFGAGKILGPNLGIAYDVFEDYVVTEGTDTSGSDDIYGYMDSDIATLLSFSAIGSVDVSTFNGANVKALYWSSLFSDTVITFNVWLSGVRAADFLVAAEIEGHSGLAIMNHVGDSGGDTQWNFTAPIPANWDGSGNSTVRLYS